MIRTFLAVELSEELRKQIALVQVRDRQIKGPIVEELKVLCIRDPVCVALGLELFGRFNHRLAKIHP